MWTSYPRYHGHVIRPPSEANSLILQVMYGCSHGDCTFCGSYLGKPFRVRPFNEVIEDVQNLPEGYKRQHRPGLPGRRRRARHPQAPDARTARAAEGRDCPAWSASARTPTPTRCCGLSQEDLDRDPPGTASSCSTWGWSPETTRRWRGSRRASPWRSRSRAATRPRRRDSPCRSPRSWASAARSARTSTPSARERPCRPSTRSTSGYCR